MRYIIGFILIVVLLIFGFTVIFRGPSKPVIKPITLPDYAGTSTVVQYTEDGKINAEQNHRQIRITVGRDSTSMNVIQGYQGTILNTKSYPNNQQAYNNFLHALALEGFTRKVSTSISDNTAVCPLSERFTFQVIDGNGGDLQKLWTASCVNGTFGGNLPNVQQLFRDQVPDYNQLVTGVSLLN